MFKVTILEHRVYYDIGSSDLIFDKLIDGIHRLLLLGLVQKLVIILCKRSRMGRKDLVHLDDLIDSISVSSLIIKRFYRS